MKLVLVVQIPSVGSVMASTQLKNMKITETNFNIKTRWKLILAIFELYWSKHAITEPLKRRERCRFCHCYDHWHINGIVRKKRKRDFGIMAKEREREREALAAGSWINMKRGRSVGEQKWELINIAICLLYLEAMLDPIL